VILERLKTAITEDNNLPLVPNLEQCQQDLRKAIKERDNFRLDFEAAEHRENLQTDQVQLLSREIQRWETIFDIFEGETNVISASQAEDKLTQLRDSLRQAQTSVQVTRRIVKEKTSTWISSHACSPHSVKMERPAGVDESTWTTWSAMYNILPTDRRTQDIPTTTAAAQASISNMAPSVMDAIRDAARAEALRNVPAQPGTGGSDSYKLPFTVKDVPQYTGDYMDYRRKLRDFVHIYQGMPLQQVPSAMFAIKTGLVEKRMSELGSSKDAAEFAVGATSLLDAWRAWQTWMDGLLISPTQFNQENATWEIMKTKARKAQSSQEFYILFETCLLRFNESCVRTNMPKPTDVGITRHFIQALPEDIAATARINAPTLDRDPYRAHKDLLDNISALHRKAPARTLLAKRGQEPESEDEADAYPAPARKRPAVARCVLYNDLDDPPRVPDMYRGNIGYFRGNSDIENRLAY
jgi:hypothetical protein